MKMIHRTSCMHESQKVRRLKSYSWPVSNPWSSMRINIPGMHTLLPCWSWSWRSLEWISRAWF